MAKTWFITGTSTGFGRILVERLLERGDTVAATLRRPDTLAALKARYGDRLWVETLDVTDGAAVHRVVDNAFAELGRVDVVVSNAGYGLFGAAEELEEDEIRRQIETNLFGSIAVVRAVLPHLRKQGGGHLIQLSSMGGQMAFPGFSLYHATKWGIEGFFEALAQEVAPFKIAVTLVEPGSARTDFGNRSLSEAAPLPDYEAGPVGAFRRARADGTYRRRGDPEKMVRAMIAAADQETPPKRLALGSDAFDRMHAALSERLAALESQKAVAYATDAADAVAGAAA